MQHKNIEIRSVTDEENFLRLECVVATEAVTEYPEYNQKVYKPAKELRDAVYTLDRGLITYSHPENAMRKVVTHPEDIIGKVDNPEFDEEKKDLKCDLLVDKNMTDDEIIEMIQNDQVTEVSLGYYCSWIEESGEFEGEEYDAIQANYVVDHVALVPPNKEPRLGLEQGVGLVSAVDMTMALQDSVKPDVLSILKDAGYGVKEEGPEVVIKPVMDSGSVPTNPEGYGTVESEEWEKPSYSEIQRAMDLGEGRFVDLEIGDKREVSQRFGYVSGDLEEAEFSDLKLPHHRPDGDVDLAGVMAARMMLPQTEDISENELNRIDRHLMRHLEEDFDMEDVNPIVDYLSKEREKYDRGGNMPNDIDVNDLDKEAVMDHDAVQDMKSELEDLKETVDSLKEEKKNLKETVDNYKEEERKELIDFLAENGMDKEALQDMELGTLKTMASAIDQKEDDKETTDDDDSDSEDEESSGEVVDTKTATKTDEKEGSLKPSNPKKIEVR